MKSKSSAMAMSAQSPSGSKYYAAQKPMAPAMNFKRKSLIEKESVENIHRVKNRPANDSIADKLAKRKKEEEQERMRMLEQEYELQQSAQRANLSPLASAKELKK